MGLNLGQFLRPGGVGAVVFSLGRASRTYAAVSAA